VKFVIAHRAVTVVTSATSQLRHVIDNMGATHGTLPGEAMHKRMIGYVAAR